MCSYLNILKLLFLILSGAYGAFIPPFLQNKAVVTGTTGVVLNCTSTISDLRSVQWSFTPVGGSNVLIFGDPGTPYIIQQPTGTQQKNLIILTPNESTAGTYYCIESTPGGATSSAQLIVVISNSSCSSNVSTELLQLQTVQMSCFFTYVGNSKLVSANMQWLNVSSPVNNNPSTSNIPSGNQINATSTFNQQTGYWSPFMYQSNTTFTMNSASLPSGAATNQPDYCNISSPFSSPVPVTYLNPGSIGITGVKPDGSVNIGATVRCWIDANSPASYNWTLSNGSMAYGPSIPIGQTGTYTCTAWNIAGSATRSTNVTNVLTTTSTSTVTNKMTNTNGGVVPNPSTSAPSVGLSSGAKIGIGVGIGVGLAALIGILIGVLFIRYKKQCAKRHSKTERSGDTLKMSAGNYEATDFSGSSDQNLQNKQYEALHHQPPNTYEQITGVSEAGVLGQRDVPPSTYENIGHQAQAGEPNTSAYQALDRSQPPSQYESLRKKY